MEHQCKENQKLTLGSSELGAREVKVRLGDVLSRANAVASKKLAAPDSGTGLVVGGNDETYDVEE